MVLMNFSELKHVDQLLNGTKRQTTRAPRRRPIKVGDELQCYFKPRMGKVCNNCISKHCGNSMAETNKPIDKHCNGSSDLPNHNNSFGIAIVKLISRVRISDMPAEMKEQWAKADGFKSFDEANIWFTNTTGSDWPDKEWNVIIFRPGWVP